VAALRGLRDAAATAVNVALVAGAKPQYGSQGWEIVVVSVLTN
jgi:hypothetical protein